jgi:hypothetical protein
MAQQKPRDYTQRFQQNGQRPGQNKGNNQQKKRQSAPDVTVHHPPGFLFLLGGLGTMSGVVTNFWQGFTTFSAMWDLETPNGSIVDHRTDSMKFGIAFIIGGFCITPRKGSIQIKNQAPCELSALPVLFQTSL